MNRNRVFSAIIENGKIAMVKNLNRNKIVFWTLPGGGMEENESQEETAIREAFEEANLRIRIIRYLYQEKYSGGIQYCYLAEPIDPNKLMTGINPEDDEFSGKIIDSEWKVISDVKDDIQVSMVLKKLTVEEKIRYKINVQ
jgi:8-oxo-dGTP pyrophosphatase MutT (NUDIX family)